MKRVSAVAAMMLAVTVGWSQSTEELDVKAGFKEFRIGDSLSVHQSKIKPMKTLDNADTKLYLVKERVSVRNYTGEVELEFYKDRVQEVTVSFKLTSAADFEDLLKSLETLYGPSEKSRSKSAEMERFDRLFTWNGKKISLRLGYDESHKLTEMVYSGHSHELEKLKSEF